jgi:hypothetical protein
MLNQDSVVSARKGSKRRSDCVILVMSGISQFFLIFANQLQYSIPTVDERAAEQVYRTEILKFLNLEPILQVATLEIG